MNEFRVGFLALIAMGTVIAMSLMVTANQSGLAKHISYRTVLNDAGGIFPKTPIRVAGINAGRIKKIDLLNNTAVLTFEVLEKVKITKNSKLRVKKLGLLGERYIEIFIGDSDELLKEMEFIKSEEKGDLSTLGQDAGSILKDLKDIVAEIKETLQPKNEEAPLRSIISNLNDTLLAAKGSVESFQELITSSDEKGGGFFDNMEQFAENLKYHTDLERDDSLMAGLDKVLANTERMTGDLQQIVGNIKAGRGTIGKILVEENMADDIQATLSGVKKLVGRADAIRTELALFMGGNSENGSKTNASLKIFPAPERFYSVGVSNAEFGPEKEKHITNTIDFGTNTTKVETINREKYKNQFRFNVQIGRQLHNWTFRGGLIESSGGLGLDYNFYRFGSRFSLDLFDYRDDLGVNLRPSYSQQLWNVIHGKISVEDAASNDLRSYTFSVGLRFNDEDLKGLLGFFL